MANVDRICSVEGCEGKHYCKDMCVKHYAKSYYKKWAERSESQRTRVFAKRGEPMSFLLSIPETDDCVLWPYSINAGGYGQVSVNRRPVVASRMSLILHVSPEPFRDAVARHVVCSNPLCVNPRHLAWGTRADNSLDMVLDGNSQRGEKQWNTILTESSVNKIRQANPRTESQQAALAAEMGVSARHIRKVLSRQAWAHVKDS